MSIKRPLSASITSAAEKMEMLEIAIQEGQDCLKKSPVIVLGSGASIPSGLPSMKDLADHLQDSIRNETLSNAADKKAWEQFIEELVTKNKDLESALKEIRWSEKLSKHVIVNTWNLINEKDTHAFKKILNNPKHLPLTKLYKYLFKSTNRTISVVTTNYDRLAEYAADSAGFCHYTGFSYGHLRQKQRRSSSRLSFKQGDQTARTVDIWKVHGCLDWFINNQNEDQVLALTSARVIPDGWRPAIVTPGSDKYESTSREPFRSIIDEADNVLESATAYLCVGFGFNDMHIQPKMLERWKQGDAFLVILTKTLSESAKSMLSKAEDQKFLALEEMKNGTRMWLHQQPQKDTELDDVHLWKLQDFLHHTVGA